MKIKEGCFFILAFYRENHWMTIAAVVNLMLGLAVHLLPVLSARKER
ncbi:hypothetical protein [Mucilaginibacter sp.]